MQAQTDNESWEDWEKLVNGVLRDQLELNDDVQFDRARRLHNNNNNNNNNEL